MRRFRFLAGNIVRQDVPLKFVPPVNQESVRVLFPNLPDVGVKPGHPAVGGFLAVLIGPSPDIAVHIRSGQNHNMFPDVCGRYCLLRRRNRLQHPQNDPAGLVGRIFNQVFIGFVGFPVRLVRHAANHDEGNLIILADRSDGRTFHFAGQGVKILLQFLHIGFRCDELIAGSNDALENMLFPQFTDGGVIGNPDQLRIAVAVVCLSVCPGEPFKAIFCILSVIVLDQFCANHHIHHLGLVPHAAGHTGKNHL